MIDPNAIADLKIYPPIGIARVGNAKGADEYVIGPELIGGTPTLPGGSPEAAARFVEDFRNARGEIKRQAARFRVYAHMNDGSVQEVTAASAKIEWHVTVANLKAGWYEFNQAMDLGPFSQHAWRRNRDLVSEQANRSRLDIVPTPKTITGITANPVELSDGAFWDVPVYLGELRTDAEGRLIFLGGRGDSRSFRPGARALTFANNPGWHDDVCDGPVRAQVTFHGHKPVDAEPGYVVVTPPNYAPGLFGVVTMDDTVREVFYDKTWIARPDETSFTSDVLPVFQRLTGLQWVNHGLFILHGFGSALDAQNSEVIAKLNDSSAANAGWRKTVLALFRDADAGGDLIEDQVPQIFGDAIDAFSGSPPEPPNGLLAVTKTQYAHLRRWAEGDFDADWSPAVIQPLRLSALPPEVQISHLERAPLHDCLGGPFHPAMEMTWVMRISRLWKSAYRLNVLAGERPAKQDFGEVLTPDVCTGANGPYDGAAAGCLTRFLGVPWQTDHTSCNSGADYFPATFLSMPTFWGPRAPDQVLAAGNYLRAAAIAHLGNPTQQQTSKHLMNRVDWLRDIRGFDYYDRLSKMIAEWSELGMVLPVRNPPASLPVQDLRVEQGRSDRGKPIDVTKDWKYHAVEDTESLFSPQTMGGFARQRAERTTAPPPKRTYRQGEI